MRVLRDSCLFPIMHPSSRFSALLMLLVVFVSLAATLPALTASALANYALIRVLSAPPCDPSWYVCTTDYRPYPPQEWSGNVSALQTAQEMLIKALALSPRSGSLQEHLVELRYSTGELDVATLELGSLLEHKLLRNAVLREDNYVFHLLRSRLFEEWGDISAAAKDAQFGLQLADSEIDPERERLEVERRSDLYGRLIEPAAGQLVSAQDIYSATLYAACAADWDVAWARAHRAMYSMQALNPEQRSVLARLLAFRARQTGDVQTEAQLLSRSGEVVWDHWTIGDPYLWLGSKLLNTIRYGCDRGAREIYAWYSRDHSTLAQGLYLEGLVFLGRSDFTNAEQAFLTGYQRDATHVDSARGLAITYQLAGNLETSVHWYQRGIELWPTNSEFHARLATVLHTLGRDEEAQKHFDEAVTLSPQEDLFLVWAGFFYMDYGQSVRARALFEKALAVNPSNPYAKQGVDKLNELSDGER